MDRFDAMRVFVRIVECRSFTQAATDLNLPRSSVADALKGMESRLGVPLIYRTTRRVSPTLDGEAYYQRCVRLLAEIEDAESAFLGATPQGLLRVNVHGALASHFVMPHLPAFLARYPNIDLFFSEGDRFVDLVEEGVDCALRVGHLADSELIARRIALLVETTCASPAYIARQGQPLHVEALDGHRMVGFHSSATGAVLPLDFIVLGKPRHVILPTDVTVNGADSYLAAGRAGLGLIQVPHYRVMEDIRRGSLVPLLEQSPPAPTPVSLVYPRIKQLSPRLRVFADWIATVMRKTDDVGRLDGPS